MKKQLVTFYLLTLMVVMSAQTLQQSMFIDFGPSDVTNGNITSGADYRKHYWNNFSTSTSGANITLKKASDGTTSTGYKLTLTSAMSKNGILNGGLLSPDTTKLGDLAVATATQDYFFTTNSVVIKFSGLNIAHGYKFYLFGSRTYSTARSTNYTISGATSQSYTMQTSGTDLGGVGYNGNNSSVFSSNIIYPDNNSEILITVAVASGGYAYLNAMKIEDYAYSQVTATAISLSGDNITATGATSQMNVVYTPTNATRCKITWAVSDTAIATISSLGIVTPKANGMVTVTGSLSPSTGKTLTATKQITITNNGAVSLYLSGTATKYGDNLSSSLLMNQVKDTSGIIPGLYEVCTNLNSIGSLKFYTSQIASSATVYGMGSLSGTLTSGGAAIYPGLSGEVLIRANLTLGTYTFYPIDTMKISIMGSSVAYGTGATSNQGYAYMYGQLLANRYSSGIGDNWVWNNISIGGNSTLDVLKRWDKDLLGANSRYVIYALSLANEGIVGGGQKIYNQFKTNIQLLVEKARSAGKIPLLTSNYTNAVYTSTEYNYIKQINRLIHQWDLPSVNMLGAVDDGTGKWATGYMYNSAHPNDAGHSEMLLSIVPSTFDALKAGKVLPVRVSGTSISLGKNGLNKKIILTPENIVHSFTNSFGVKTTGNGIISSFKTASGVAYLKINSSGNLVYQSPTGSTIQSKSVVNDGNWHQVTLSHYYARGITMLYSDSIKCDSLVEKQVSQEFDLSDNAAPNTINYREWFFYRSGMNKEEITLLNRGVMLKSSLEIYAPLYGNSQITDTLSNLAQSLNSVKFSSLLNTEVKTTTQNPVKIYPNPVENVLNIDGLSDLSQQDCFVYDRLGKLLLKISPLVSNKISLASSSSGLYLLALVDENTKSQTLVQVIKK